MKQIFNIILLLTIAMLSTNVLLARFDNGSGTLEDPFQIATKADLQKVRYYLSAHFIQTADIVFTSEDYKEGGDFYNDGLLFQPLSNLNHAFFGTYDGLGHTIDSLRINRPDEDFVGLFGCIAYENTKVSNLSVTNVDIVGSYSVGVIGTSLINSTIENVNSSGKISGEDEIGGLLATNFDAILRNCWSTVEVNGREEVGGLVGLNYSNSIYNSYSLGSVNGRNHVGGFVGLNSAGATISSCYSRGDVKGIRSVGGFAGLNSESIIENSYTSSNVVADTNVGGFVGANHKSDVSYCYSTGKVEGKILMGGFVGVIDSSNIIYSFWDVQTSGMTESVQGEGKTTNEMKIKSTFTDANWDFGLIWDIDGISNDGYPFLRKYITSVDDRIYTENEILVYPNPASDYIEISGLSNPKLQLGANDDYVIKIYNTFGEIVISDVEHLDRIDISHLPVGTYFIRIGNKLNKFVKI